MEPANVLKIESLKEGWRDNDFIILHACFQLLKDCVENEKLLNGHINWGYDAETKTAKEKIEFLYNWWIERCRKDSLEEINDLDKAQYKEDNEMLKQLIDIRKYLWT